mmetsp:Transcript_6449/g.18265  ORF Transcript_6449/g.18265 Transcript_6449/m.18265 type:complete len:161 (-) Transcript_6449:55-537(-)
MGEGDTSKFQSYEVRMAAAGTPDERPAGRLRELARVGLEHARAFWEKQPLLTIAVVFFLVGVIAAGGVVFLAMVGALDNEELWDTEEERIRGIEIASQILNALFTIAAVYNHPTRCCWTYKLCAEPKFLTKGRFYPLTTGEISWILLNMHFNCFFQVRTN